MALTFYREQKRWAFTHAVLPLAVYIATRDPVLSLLLAYVWESVELLVSLRYKYFREKADDSLIGDPLNATLSILAMFLLDTAFGWAVAFRAEVSIIRRLLCLIALAAPASLIEVGDSTNRRFVHTGVLLYTVFYTAVALAVYVPIFSSVSAGVANSVLTWLLIVNVYALAIAPLALSLEFPPYLRIISVSLLIALLGGILVLSLK
jgi:hypothetical protein